MAGDRNDPKSLILARRAKFVAAALAGVTGVATACGGATEGSGNPEPCLGIECCPDDPPPQPCLSKPFDPPDADAEAETDATDASGDSDSDSDAKTSDADAEPQPCLSPLPGDQ